MSKEQELETDPWGTTHYTFWGDEENRPILTEKHLFVKKDLNQYKTAPPCPKLDSRCETRMVWSIVSKAEDMSSNTKMTESPKSVAIKISSITRVRVVSVLCRALNPN